MSTEFLEKYTYENILNDALSRVSSSVDKRQGSIIYDALAPACYELAMAYIEIAEIMDQTFVATATGTYLEDRVADFGVTRISATKAVKKGTFNILVPVGTRFSAGTLVYAVTELISGFDYKLECETAGTVGNSFTGALIPITFVDGLESAVITDLLIPARDTETDQELIDRFFEQVKQEAMDGNVAQYLKWATDFGQIGKCKIFPLWDGVNTVKASILNNTMGVASQVLIDDFQEYLDPNSEGLGNGVAPIGAIVTVTTATELTVDMSVSVTLQDGYVQVVDLEAQLEAWFREISYDKSGVSYYGVAAIMLANKSIKNIQNLLVNSGTIDIVLGAEQIPVLGTLTVTVV